MIPYNIQIAGSTSDEAATKQAFDALCSQLRDLGELHDARFTVQNVPAPVEEPVTTTVTPPVPETATTTEAADGTQAA